LKVVLVIVPALETCTTYLGEYERASQ